MGNVNIKEQLCDAIAKDDDITVKKILELNPSLNNSYINKTNDYNALCFAAYYGNIKVMKVLLEVLLTNPAK
jgi:hypothetical protein